MPPSLSVTLRPLVVGLIYFTAAAATITTTRFGNGVAFIWIANAVLVAELLLLRRRDWAPTLAACAVASFTASACFGVGLALAGPLSLVNMSESVIGALLLRHLCPGSRPFDSLAGVMALIVSVGFVGPAVTAPLAGFAVATLGVPFIDNVLRWYAGHALGALTFMPIASFVLAGEVGRWRRSATISDAAEAAVILAAVAATTIVVFSQAQLPLLFLPILPVVIATFRIGTVGGALAMLLVTLIGGFLTVRGYGPIDLIGAESGDRLQFLQFYLATVVLIVLPVTADLTQRTRLTTRLRESEARYRVLADNSSDIVMNLDANGCIRFASRSIATLGGYDPAAVIGRKARDFVHPGDIALVLGAHRDAYADPSQVQVVEYRGITADKSPIWLEAHIQCIVDEDGQPSGLVSTIRGVEYRKVRERELVLEAITDPLTNLLNRRGFFDGLETMLPDAHAQGRGCLALFDLDHFKKINDEHGHASGDRVLEEFAIIAKQVVRDDDLIGRLGGEEFGVVLRGVNWDQAVQVCERLRARVAAHISFSDTGEPIRVTVSAGIVPLFTGDREHIYREADAALYRAKADGRNRLSLAA